MFLCSAIFRISGSHLSAQGVATDPAKTQAIATWPTPKDVK